MSFENLSDIDLKRCMSAFESGLDAFHAEFWRRTHEKVYRETLRWAYLKADGAI